MDSCVSLRRGLSHAGGEIPGELTQAGDGTLDDRRLDDLANQRHHEEVPDRLLCDLAVGGDASDSVAPPLEEDAGMARVARSSPPKCGSSTWRVGWLPDVSS